MEQKQIEEMARDLLECCPYIPCNGIGTAEKVYNKGYRKQEWISVEDRLPSESGKYLVCSNNNRWKQGNVYQARYSTTNGWCQRDKGKGITHWMPLPPPPKMKGAE